MTMKTTNNTTRNATKFIGLAMIQAAEEGKPLACLPVDAVVINECQDVVTVAFCTENPDFWTVNGNQLFETTFKTGQ